MPVLIESKLAQAARHVAEGRIVVARQRVLIAKQKEAGRDTFYSENLLDQFERTLAIFEDHLRQIEAETVVGIPAKQPIAQTASSLA